MLGSRTLSLIFIVVMNDILRGEARMTKSNHSNEIIAPA